MAKEAGHKGYSKMKKTELCQLLKLTGSTGAKKKTKIPTPEKMVKKQESLTPKMENILEESPTKKQLDMLSEYLKSDLKEYYKFRGSYAIEWGWLLWLEKKLGISSLCVWKDKKGNDYGIRYNALKKILSVESWVIEDINACYKSKSRFVVGIASLKLQGGGFHANAFIFDLKNNILTRFEPHGGKTMSYDMSKFDIEVQKWLDKTGPLIGIPNKKWIYHSPPKICPTPGPQSRESSRYVKEALQTKKVFGKEVKSESSGFCSAWSLIYIHFRVKNPDYTDEEILKYILGLSDKELSYMIREYAEFIMKTIDPNWVAKEGRKKFKKGDYVWILDQRDGGVYSYGKILEMKQNKAVVWEVERKRAKKYKYGRVLNPLFLLNIVEPSNHKIIAFVDKLMKEQNAPTI